MRRFFALSLVLTFGTVSAQEPPKPGPEHEMLKKFEGNWDMTMKMPQGEAKGTCTYRMDLGGLWLSSTVEMDMGGIKFQGKGMDSYDAEKKKYVGVWFDSMSTSPLNMTGDFDKETKTLKMTGEGPGMDGKLTKQTITSTWTSEDSFTFKMHHGDAKEPVFTIEYKRKK